MITFYRGCFSTDPKIVNGTLKADVAAKVRKLEMGRNYAKRFISANYYRS